MDEINNKIELYPELEQYRDLLTANWDNWNEHVIWVRDATVAEITDWAEACRAA